MEIVVTRKYRKEGYCIGEMAIDGVRFCDTLEPEDRGLDSSMSAEEIKNRKIMGKTAIPVGRFKVRMDVVSPRLGKRPSYAFCDGKLPRLVGVPGFKGVLIHIGNWKEDTGGCILVGRNVKKGGVLYSTQTFRMLYEILSKAKAL